MPKKRHGWQWMWNPVGAELEQIARAAERRNVFGIDPRNAPHVLAPGLQVVLGQAPAYGSRETVGCSVRRTSSPAKSSSVQRARPAGGLEQAVATSGASSFPESLRLAPGRFAERCFQIA
jgi:hypothetical protein